MTSNSPLWAIASRSVPGSWHAPGTSLGCSSNTAMTAGSPAANPAAMNLRGKGAFARASRASDEQGIPGWNTAAQHFVQRGDARSTDVFRPLADLRRTSDDPGEYVQTTLR